MTANLDNAICNLLAKAEADGSILRVSETAERLAKEHGGDSRQIAALMTNAGLTTGISMDLRSPVRKEQIDSRKKASVFQAWPHGTS